MIDQQLYLFEQGLKEQNFSAEEMEFLRTIGQTLATHPEILRACHIARLDKEEVYHYQPVIGAPLSFYFEENQVRIDRNFTFSLAVFLRYLANLELTLGKIYPLGTIVELDKRLLSDRVVDMFEKRDLDFLAIIQGQRVLLDEHSYIDYIANVWPFGYELDAPPLFLSNLYIKRVLVEGYTGDQSSQYCDKELREGYFMKNIHSSLYGGEADED